MRQYLELLYHVQDFGTLKADRTGTGTKSVFGWQSRYNLANGFPLLTTKRVYLRAIIHELLWFLSGETNIKYLLDNDVHIWDEWADENGELGPVYGHQWRHWPGKVHLLTKPGVTAVPKTTQLYDKFMRGELDLVAETVESAVLQEPIDQIAKLVQRIKDKPDDRRLIVSAWNVADIDSMALPPCHCMFQVYTREMTVSQRDKWAMNNLGRTSVDEHSEAARTKVLDDLGVPRRALDLQLYQRSCDLFLGVPFNIAGYALLQMMLAQVCGMAPGMFIHTYGDAHIYKDHFEQVALQLSREPRRLPTMRINPEVKDIFGFKYEDFTLTGYDPHPVIKAEVSV